MQDGIWRAVGVVLDRVSLGPVEAVPGVETGDLQFAGEAQFVERRVGDTEEIVVVEEIVQNPGVDQQRRFFDLGVGLVQVPQLLDQLGQQVAWIARGADDIPDLFFQVDGFGEGAKPQADHRARQPGLGPRDDVGGGVGFLLHGGALCGLGSRKFAFPRK